MVVRTLREEAVDFDGLYRSEYVPLLRVAYGLTGSRAEAEELVQEAFLRCHQRWAQVSSYDRPGAWLRRVVVNLATSRARRVVVEARALVRLGARPAPQPELGMSAESFWAAVRRLPPRQAAAVVLYYAEDQSVADVAAAMECAEGTVRALLHQARRSLAKVLDADAEEQP